MNFSACVLGIELGSTRIKGVLIDESHNVIASGSYGWENSLVNGVWTYELKDAVIGVQTCFAQLKKDAEQKFGQFCGSGGSNGVAPGTERCQLITRFIKDQIAVHHTGNTDTGNTR